VTASVGVPGVRAGPRPWRSPRADQHSSSPLCRGGERGSTAAACPQSSPVTGRPARSRRSARLGFARRPRGYKRARKAVGGL